MKINIIYEFEVGDWLIGPPVNVPTRVMEIHEDHFVGMLPNGVTGQFEFNKEDDKPCCPLKLAMALQLTILDRMTDEQYDRITNLVGREPNFQYDPEIDTLYMNTIVVYQEGKFKDISQL